MTVCWYLFVYSVYIPHVQYINFITFFNKNILPFFSHKTADTHWLDPRLANLQKQAAEDCNDDGKCVHNIASVSLQSCYYSCVSFKRLTCTVFSIYISEYWLIDRNHKFVSKQPLWLLELVQGVYQWSPITTTYQWPTCTNYWNNYLKLISVVFCLSKRRWVLKLGWSVWLFIHMSSLLCCYTIS